MYCIPCNHMGLTHYIPPTGRYQIWQIEEYFRQKIWLSICYFETSSCNNFQCISGNMYTVNFCCILLYPPLQQSWMGSILVPLCLSVRLWWEWCWLCIFHNTSWIHFIYAHLMHQLDEMCHMLRCWKKFKIWIFKLIPDQSCYCSHI